jgi:hypothetical protein
MKNKALIRGAISYIPGLLPFLKKIKGEKKYGGTDSARYCYSVWMRHFKILNENFGKQNIKKVAEIGPGDSLGMGLMALITGAEKYFVFEVKKSIATKKNLDVFEELVDLFINKSKIPGDEEFPFMQPKLDSYEFPESIFRENFDKLIDENRLNKIRRAIESENNNEFEINYIVPWFEKYKLLIGSIDFIFSQAVMEHLNDLDSVYKIMYNVLSPGGIMSHEIDYSAHETHKSWNGHLNYGDIIWKILMHGREYEINRMPHSMHINCMIKHKFSSIKEMKTKSDCEFPNVKNEKIRNVFKEEDNNIQNALIQAMKL